MSDISAFLNSRRRNFDSSKSLKSEKDDEDEERNKIWYRQCCGGLGGKVLDRIEKRAKENQEFAYKHWYGMVLVLGYMMSGFLYFQYKENWDWVDSMYFSVVTSTTVGYGDLTPKSEPGRIFTTVYVAVGVFLIGAVFSIAGDTFATAQMEAIAKLEKRRQEKVLRDMNEEEETVESNFDPKNLVDSKEAVNKSEMRDNLEDEIPTVLMLLKSCFVFFFLWSIFCAVFYVQLNEDADKEGNPYSSTDIFYFLVVTITTVGYGDISPKSRRARICGIVLIPIAVLSMGGLITTIASWYSTRKLIKEQLQYTNRGLSEEDLAEMDQDNDNEVTKLEFIEFMLISMDKCDRQFLERLHEQFRKLDNDNSGTLDMDDLKSAVGRSNKNSVELERLENNRWNNLSLGRTSLSFITTSLTGGKNSRFSSDSIPIVEEQNNVEVVDESFVSKVLGHTKP